MNDGRIAIDWDSARASNRDNWEDRVPLHEQAYGISDFDDPNHLTRIIRTDLAALVPFLPDGSVSGLDVCHLQCHIGTDTLSLAKTIPWKFAPRMVEVPEGFAWPESERDLVPCTYTIIARKAGE
jgi:hypothetical protein